MLLSVPSRARRRRVVALGACALGTAALVCAALAGSCTTFNGLEAEGKKPPPATLPDGYLSMSDAARVCTRVMSCSPLASDVMSAIGVPLDTLNFSSCMEWAAGPIPSNRIGFSFQQEVLQCIAKAKTCQEAGACLPLETMAPDDPRCAVDAGVPEAAVGDAEADGDAPEAAAPPDPNDLTEWCADDGGTVIKCKGQYKYALHCRTGYFGPGSHCVEDVDHTKWCAVGDNCNVWTSCLNLMLDYCGGPASYVHESINCRFAGRTCGTDPDSGLIECLSGDSIQTCAAAGVECRDNVIAVCDGMNLAYFDCSSLKRKCSSSQGAARCVQPDADVCTPFDQNGVNACTGTSISLCIAGAKTSFDCTSIGMTCVPGAGAQSSHCG